MTDSTHTTNKETLVSVEDVSKKFCRGLKRSLWYGAHDIVSEIMGKSKGKSGKLREDEFWAVRDLSFKLERGECLGLIGHNGAGKSTLLKMLNGLIKPDKGRIEMRGRIGALIEMSAGFNPILTGRENIYNKGAVLGFTKKEVDHNFDAIVDFAEIEEFIDMPVQNYSSGMRVRLGFAVSAQMEPDVLLIDEVLAVGDLGFIIKCLNRMAEILPNSAVIFVSHSMPMVSRMCSRALLMDKGNAEYLGADVPYAIERYIHKFGTGEQINQGSGEIVVERVGLGLPGSATFVFDDSYVHENGRPLQIKLGLCIVDQFIPPFDIFLIVYDQQLREIISVNSRENTPPFHCGDGSGLIVEVSLPNIYLNQGKHTVTVGAVARNNGKVFCRTNNTITFMVRSKIQSWATCVIPADWREIRNVVL